MARKRERRADKEGTRERGNEGTRKRASERERVCNDGLVRAGLLHTRKISREKQRRVRREEDREIHREEQAGRQAGRAGGGEGGRASEIGRKFSSGAFICSFNEMRMHYTWIAGDINFLPWTCSGPWRAAGWSVLRSRRGLAVSTDEARGLQREGVYTSIEENWREKGRERAGYSQIEKPEREREGEREREREENVSKLCVVLTRSTTCQLFPSFLPTFASSAVILTSGRRGVSRDKKKECTRAVRYAGTRDRIRGKTCEEFSRGSGGGGGRRNTRACETAPLTNNQIYRHSHLIFRASVGDECNDVIHRRGITVVK